MMEESERSQFGESDPLMMGHSHSRKCKGVTFHLVYAIFTCVLGTSFQFGYSTGVVNAPEQVIKEFLKKPKGSLDESKVNFVWSVIVSIWCIGGIIGAFLGGMIADRYGRKKAMFINNVPMVMGSVLMGLSYFVNLYELLILGRFVIGVACGISTSISSIYLSEISPINLRGSIGVLNQLTIVIALLFSQILGLKNILGSERLWPYLLGAQLIPSILQILLLIRCPESPRFTLLKLENRDQAEQILHWLRDMLSVQDDLQEMLKEQDKERFMAKVSILDLFRDISLRKPLMISIIMMLSQQFSGINAVIYYSTDIFTSSGLNLNQAQYSTIGIGGVNVIMTLISSALMDRSGRRVLHLYGLGIMFVFANLLTISFLWQPSWAWMSYFSILATIGFIVGFAIGPGSIPWFFVTELFAQRSRAAASSVAVVVNWSANFAIGIGFPFMQKHLSHYSFLPFVALLALFWTFTYFKVPETKNLTIEEITARFRTPGTLGDRWDSSFDPYASSGPNVSTNSNLSPSQEDQNRDSETGVRSDT